MEKITVSKFKATCLEIFERISKTGESYLITKRGIPVATVVPAPPESIDKKSLFGCMSETAEELEDILEPLPIDDWEVLN